MRALSANCRAEYDLSPDLPPTPIGLVIAEDATVTEPATATMTTPPGGGRLRRALAGRYGEVLRLRTFRLLWGHEVLSAGSEAVGRVAMPLLVYDITGSAALLGLIFVIQSIPRLVLSPVAGVLADRVDRRRMLIVTGLARAGVVALIPFAGSAWEIAGLAAVVAVGNALAQPCQLAAVPSVLSPGALVSGISLIQITNNLARVAGPALGATLIGFTGTGPAFLLQAAMFAGGGALAWRMVLPPRQVVVGSPGVGGLLRDVWRDAADGVRIVARTPVVRGITLAEFWWSAVSACFVVACVVYTQDTLDLGDRADRVYGYLMAFFSGGTIAGALIAGRLEARIGRPALLGLGYLGPLFLIPAVLTPPLPALYVCFAALGVLDALAVLALQSYLAESVDDTVRGRVYATWIAGITLGSIISYSAMGWLTDAAGAANAIALTGVVVGIGGPALLWVSGALAVVRAHSEVAPAE